MVRLSVPIRFMYTYTDVIKYVNYPQASSFDADIQYSRIACYRPQPWGKGIGKEMHQLGTKLFLKIVRKQTL